MYSESKLDIVAIHHVHACGLNGLPEMIERDEAHVERESPTTFFLHIEAV